MYTSWALSLSILEILIQVLDYEDLLDYVAIPAAFNERHVATLEPADLPVDWRTLPSPASTKAAGTRWAQPRKFLLLRVPSVVVPSEYNYLINPEHPASNSSGCSGSCSPSA